MVNKEVFILGAGFSKPAGLPLQRELLTEILSINSDKLDLSFRMYFETSRSEVREFIERYFDGVEPNKLTLEDLFTILDKAIIGKEYFGDYKWENLYRIKKALIYTIVIILHFYMEKALQTLPEFYYKLVNYIIEKRLQQTQEDHISIISLNWDTLIEFLIHKQREAYKEKKISVDYCTYTYQLSKKSKPNSLFPDITLKARGYHNIKVIKPHGSINWLFCPKCKRLFVSKESNIGISLEKECQYCCKKNGKCNIRLENLIITPTMLKDLTNTHLRYIWHNAFIELQEACKIIFIGYSFPISDYELRYLFKSAIPKDVEIIVVLKESKNVSEIKERYKNFFGSKRIKFEDDGVEKWVCKYITVG